MQRILLGRYAISAGPFSIPDLTTELVASLSSAVSTIGQSSRPPEPGPPEPGPEEPGPPEPGPQITEEPGLPAWTQVNDANLAVVGLRIELERELRRLASRNDVPQGSRIPLRKIASDLAGREVINYQIANDLQDLLTIGNQAAHGQADIDNSVLGIVRTEGLEILSYLRSIY